MNPLFTDNDHEQTYPEQPKIINSTIGDDQINSNIIFNDPNLKVYNGSVDHDKNVHDSYELEQLATNAYKEAEKQQKKLIEADLKTKRLETELQNQFIQDRDNIRALEQERDELQLKVLEQAKHVLELQNTQSVLKCKMNADEDKYLDDILNLKAKVKTNENVVIKMSQSVEALFILGPKPLSFFDPKLKHGLGYENPYTLKKVIAHNPKLYNASCFNHSKVHVNVYDIEEILENATKSQIKMENKPKDPIAIEKKQNFSPIDYKKLNALYEMLVPQLELSAEQKYFSSVYMTSGTSSHASTSSSPPATMPKSSNIMKHFHTMEHDFEKFFTLLKNTSTPKSNFFTSKEDTLLNDFCCKEVKPILNDLHSFFKIIQKWFLEEVKIMMNVFESMESDLDAT
ncbi:hypothetical protein Tco_0723174 [Tanacetum coccineum]